jgi:hypothetical protein
MQSKMKNFDIQSRLEQHIKATTERDKWAQKAIKLLNDGNHKAGMEAASKAEESDMKVKLLEIGKKSRKY